MSEILIPMSLFLVIFGLAYLHYSTRNKERMALIEKGADASIFVQGKKGPLTPVWKIVILNLSLLLMGIGIAIFLAAVMVKNGMDDDVAYPGTIFLMSGIGLMVGFFMTKKLEKND